MSTFTIAIGVQRWIMAQFIPRGSMDVMGAMGASGVTVADDTSDNGGNDTSGVGGGATDATVADFSGQRVYVCIFDYDLREMFRREQESLDAMRRDLDLMGAEAHAGGRGGADRRHRTAN